MDIKGRGFLLVESVCTVLEKDYGTILSPEEVVKKISEELLTNLEYTTFMKSPLNQYDMEYNLLENNRRGKATCDMYLPAMANALDIHIRVIQKIGDYFAVMNTTPTKASKNKNKRKTVNIAYNDQHYSPIVYISREGKVPLVNPQQQGSSNSTIPSTSTQEDATVEDASSTQIVRESPPPVIIISSDEDDVQVIPSSNPEVDCRAEELIFSPSLSESLDGTEVACVTFLDFYT